jgi:predicted cobalt transporter CbtA
VAAEAEVVMALLCHHLGEVEAADHITTREPRVQQTKVTLVAQEQADLTLVVAVALVALVKTIAAGLVMVALGYRHQLPDHLLQGLVEVVVTNLVLDRQAEEITMTLPEHLHLQTLVAAVAVMVVQAGLE